MALKKNPIEEVLKSNTSYDKAFRELGRLEGDSTQYDPIYDAINALKKGGSDYNAVYKAIDNVGGAETTQFDPIYDIVREQEKNDLLKYHNKEETATTSAPAVSQNVSAAMQLLEKLRQQQYGDPYGAKLNELIDAWNKREDFSYSLDSDPLYQMARENAVRTGNLAMRDTMGRASAMTGGYGNSYAQAAGQQIFDAYLQELNNKAPEYMNAAYTRFQDDANRALQEISLVQQQRENDASAWEANYQKELDYVSELLKQEQADAENKILQEQYAADKLLEALDKEKENQKWLAERDLAAAKEGFSINSDGTIVRDKTTGEAVTYGTPNNTKNETPVVEPSEVSDGVKALQSGLSNFNMYLDRVRASIDTSGAKPNEAEAIRESYINQLKYEVFSNTLFGRVANNAATPGLGQGGWSVTDKGGKFIGSINDNALVKYTDNNGNETTYRLDDLIQALVNDGIPKAKAKEAVLNLQNQLKAYK